MDTYRAIVWRRVLDDLSVERAEVRIGDVGCSIAGSISSIEDGASVQVDYEVCADSAWRTRTAKVTCQSRDEIRTIELARRVDGSWTIDGVAAPWLEACIDVDLELSPSTNMLPVRRLALGIGETAEIQVAWVHFPSLEVTRGDQGYERLDARSYKYRSLGTDFQAIVTVDDQGMPVDYEGIWHRTAETELPR